MSTQNKKARIVLVDDHPAVLRQTAELLSHEFDVVATLEHGRGVMALAANNQIDILVIDISLPGMTGIELVARLRKAGCAPRIVFLTVHADADYAHEAFEVGALGYVVKPRLASDLIPALRAALAGEPFVSPCPELKEISEAVCVRPHPRQNHLPGKL